MKKTKLTIVLLLCIAVTYAQKDTVHLKRIAATERNIITDRAPQAIYFQLGGSAPLLSANYDRRFSKKVNGFGFAAGLGFFGVSGASIFSVPVSINYLFGQNTHFIELAGGATYISATLADVFDGSSNTAGGFIYHINVGYRHQPTTGGFFFRGGISPLFVGGVYVTSYYLGFGHNF